MTVINSAMSSGDPARHVPQPHHHRRSAMHAALGEPIRLAMVEDLASSDRSPGELASRYGLATNLVAHHLDVLADAGLIERFPSSGDKRRRYVRLSLPSAREVLGSWRPTGVDPARRALFVCSANSARSQLAAALWRARTGGEANSAGTNPAKFVHPGAIAAAHRAGLDLSRAEPRELRGDEYADVVITVCDRAHEELTPAPGWWHWSTPDPVALSNDGKRRDSSDPFDVALAQLDARIATVTNPISTVEPS